jgi:hypothetical protein
MSLFTSTAIPPMLRDYSHGRKCGIREHIHLLAAKPELGSDENSDFTRLECIGCYGAGFDLIALDHIKLSVAPKLATLYDNFAAQHG